MKLHLFNPENDLALACGNSNYCPPPSACAIADNLATLPLWFAAPDDVVFCDGEVCEKYRKKMSEAFPLPLLFEPSLLAAVDACRPWGWSAMMRRRFKDMGICENILPSNEELCRLRALSNRKSAIALLSKMKSAGIDAPALPLYLTSVEDVARFVASVPRSVVKAPWSGSGKGLAWGIGRMELPVEHFCRGVIRRQGGVVCECFFDKVVDFAMEFEVLQGRASFAGYSLFTCVGGAYAGNILASDDDIEKFLSLYVSAEVLKDVKNFLCDNLPAFLAHSGYEGFLGVDMLIYKNDSGVYSLYPCVEINLRMNMGAASRLFYNNFVAEGRVGRFWVKNYRSQGEALAEREEISRRFPSCVADGKLLSGSLFLSPVTADSRYVAYAVVNEGASVPSLYFE